MNFNKDIINKMNDFIRTSERYFLYESLKEYGYRNIFEVAMRVSYIILDIELKNTTYVRFYDHEKRYIKYFEIIHINGNFIFKETDIKF